MSSQRAALITPETGYDFGPGHPMGPGRVARTMALADALGVLALMDEVNAEPVSDEVLLTVHSQRYIDAVREATRRIEFGLGTEDNPVRAGMHTAASAVVAATLAGAKQIRSGPHRRAINISGGLHHAMPAAASGFCVYNDSAIAIKWLLDSGVDKIVYLDVDAHHGDGVQLVFADEPRVLTISLHQSPVELFPGTGFAAETGGSDAPGSMVNVALPGGTDDAGWHRAFEAIVPEVIDAFGPDVIVSQHGCDSHAADPLTDLRLSVDGQRDSYLAIADLVDEYAGGNWLAVGGGGYSVDQVVYRAWTHLLAIVAGQPVALNTPIPDVIRNQIPDGGPAKMTDLPATDEDSPSQRRINFTSFRSGYDPASRLDQAIMATRNAAFPELGLLH